MGPKVLHRDSRADGSTMPLRLMQHWRWLEGLVLMPWQALAATSYSTASVSQRFMSAFIFGALWSTKTEISSRIDALDPIQMRVARCPWSRYSARHVLTDLQDGWKKR